MTGAPGTGSTAVVTGAGRGFGRGIAAALVGQGVRVTGLARTGAELAAVRDDLGPAFVPLRADATDPGVAAEVLDRCRPDVLVLNAGAAPVMGPLSGLSWEDFRRPWEVDVRQAFEWVGAVLRRPPAPGTTVVLVSSGAAVHGSPLSGGYAGAKSTVRFVARYAALEAGGRGLDLRFVTLLPQLTPATGLGAAAVAAYARAQGVDAATFARGLRPPVTPEGLGAALVDLLAGLPRAAGPGPWEYLLTGAGARPVDPAAAAGGGERR